MWKLERNLIFFISSLVRAYAFNSYENQKTTILKHRMKLKFSLRQKVCSRQAQQAHMQINEVRLMV